MKIKNIAAICKKNKTIVLFEKHSESGDTVIQYIGDGGAAYPVTGLPPLDTESVLTIFDVPEKDRDKYAKTGAGTQRAVRIQCDCEGERPCKAYLHDHEFDRALPEEIPLHACKQDTG